MPIVPRDCGRSCQIVIRHSLYHRHYVPPARVIRPFVLRLFALTPFASLHFFIYAHFNSLAGCILLRKPIISDDVRPIFEERNCCVKQGLGVLRAKSSVVE